MSDFFLDIERRGPHALTGWRDGRAVLHGEFLARTAAWRALALRTPGHSVALYLADSIEFGAALMGAWLAGKTVWLTADTLPASCAALAVSVDAFFGEFPDEFRPALPAADDACELAWHAAAPAFSALVVHTSGSTGAAQAIPKQFSQLSAEVATLETQFGALLGPSAIVATVSHQHIYGLLFKVLWPLAAGRPIHAHSLFFPEQLAQALGQGRCALVASPAHLKRLPDHIDWQAAAANLRAVFSSGGMLEPEAAANASDLLGKVPVEVYGSSETGGIGWRQRLAGDAGGWQALPGVSWRAGADGLLEVQSAHAGDCWVALADRVAPADSGGFLLLGRSDRIVKVEEKRISLDALEAALLACPLVLEARMVFCPEARGQRPGLAAIVVPSAEGRALLASEGKLALNRRLRALLAATVEAAGLPRRWRYPAQLPLDAQGKSPHALLLALFDEGTGERPSLPGVRVLESAPLRVLLEVRVPPDLLYFDGHFKDAPVLPGVAQLDWAIHFGRAHFSLPPQFHAVLALKFQQMIGPGQVVSLELLHEQAKGSLKFRYFSEAGPHSGGRILFQ